MLYGPPGTGKTALARAFAEDLNMPIYVYNLAEMGNHDLMKAWAEMQMNVPCIALIEDIDNVFHGRENVARKNAGFSDDHGPAKKDDDEGRRPRPRHAWPRPLTFDCLLNCLDGVERADGIFTIITTNDIGQGGPGPRPAAEAAGRDDRVHQHPPRPGGQGGRTRATWSRPTRRRWPAASSGRTRRSTWRCWSSWTASRTCRRRRPSSRSGAPRSRLRCFWKEQAKGDGVVAVEGERLVPSKNGTH